MVEDGGIEPHSLMALSLQPRGCPGNLFALQMVGGEGIEPHSTMAPGLQPRGRPSDLVTTDKGAPDSGEGGPMTNIRIRVSKIVRNVNAPLAGEPEGR